MVTTEFKSGGLHEKHVEATWKGGNHLSICSWTQGKHVVMLLFFQAQLGEGLALEAEKALCNLLCFNTERLIRMKFIEGCLENLANNW